MRKIRSFTGFLDFTERSLSAGIGVSITLSGAGAERVCDFSVGFVGLWVPFSGFSAALAGTGEAFFSRNLATGTFANGTFANGFSARLGLFFWIFSARGAALAAVGRDLLAVVDFTRFAGAGRAPGRLAADLGFLVDFWTDGAGMALGFTSHSVGIVFGRFGLYF